MNPSYGINFFGLRAQNILNIFLLCLFFLNLHLFLKGAMIYGAPYMTKVVENHVV